MEGASEPVATAFPQIQQSTGRGCQAEQGLLLRASRTLRWRVSSASPATSSRSAWFIASSAAQMRRRPGRRGAPAVAEPAELLCGERGLAAGVVLAGDEHEPE